MFRLTALLVAAIFLAFLIGGRDYGQLRPGLAAARGTTAPQAPAPVPVQMTVLEAPADGLTPARPLVSAAVEPARPEVAAVPDIVPQETVREPVFSLATFAEGNPIEPVPGADAPVGGDVRYVTAASVNVREGPSTDFAVIDRLVRGDAALVVVDEGADWTLIRIEGDGVEGYVASRFLAAAPAGN